MNTQNDQLLETAITKYKLSTLTTVSQAELLVLIQHVKNVVLKEEREEVEQRRKENHK